MFGGLNRTLAVVAAAGAALVVSPAALAGGCNGGPSAQNVYTECLGSGGGGKSTSHSGGSGGASTGGGSHSAPVPISHQTKVALAKAGADGKSLKHLVKAYGGARILQSTGSGTGTEPSAVGSAFDVGSGPTALLIVLAGTAVLLLAASGFSVARQRRH
jgi:hypothetical protein